MKTSRNTGRAMALAVGLAFAGGASATGTSANPASPLVQECVDAWNESDANDYCDATIGRITSNDQNTDCQIRSANCSVTVNVLHGDPEKAAAGGGNTVPTTFGKLFDTYNVPKSDTGNQTLCLDPNTSTKTYDLALRTSCEAGETDADTAVSEGLHAVGGS